MTTTLTLAVLLLFAALTGCKGPPEQRHHMPQASAERGRQAIERVGCGACHYIPGIWPQGRLAASLDGFADRTLIAGRIPNRPDLLARFVRDAPRTVPGAAMPAMPLTREEGRDVAAYLYTLGDR